MFLTGFLPFPILLDSVYALYWTTNPGIPNADNIIGFLFIYLFFVHYQQMLVNGLVDRKKQHILETYIVLGYVSCLTLT